jgi:lipopolysaccharide export system protein LptC
MQMVEQVKRKHKLRNEQIAFIGDELVDLPVLRRVGFAVAVPNAMDEVKRVAHYVTRRRGGDGAVREVIEMILKAQGSWQKVIAKYMALLAVGLLFAGGRVLAGGATNAPRDNATGYIEKFEVPERDENGNLKWKLNGDKAQIRPDGLMNVINARAEFYTSNRLAVVFTSPTCLLDRFNNRATTDDPVRIERDNVVVTGIGGDWDGATSSLSIHSNVQVIIVNKPQVAAPESKPQ